MALPLPRRRLAPARSETRSDRRRASTTMLLLHVMALYCLTVLAVVDGQGLGGSLAGSAAGSLPSTSAPPPMVTTSAPTTSAPTTTAPAPAPTTLAPTTTTPAPTPTTLAPTTTTPAPAETETPTPTPTLKKKKTNNNVTDDSGADADVVAAVAPVAPVENVPETDATSDASAPLSPAMTPSNGALYGGKNDSSSQASDVTTKSAADDSKSVVQFAVVAAGVLAVVAAVAMSVRFHQKRRSLEQDNDDDDKYLTAGVKRLTNLEMHEPPISTTADAPPPSGAMLYDNYSTPAARDWGTRTVMASTSAPPSNASTTNARTGPAVVDAYRDSDNLVAASSMNVAPHRQSFSPDDDLAPTVASTATASTFVGRPVGENDVTGGEEDRATAVKRPDYVEENFRSPRGGAPMRVTVNRITKCRGQSEDVTNDPDHSLSQFGSGLLLATTYGSEAPAEFHNSQMFAFSDSGSEADRDSARSTQSRDAAGASSDVSEFLKYYNGPVVATTTHTHVDVDADEEYDDEEILGRSTRSSSLYSDFRSSEFLTGGLNRASTSSSIMEFHDSTVDRPSELDEGEFEV